MYELTNASTPRHLKWNMLDVRATVINIGHSMRKDLMSAKIGRPREDLAKTDDCVEVSLKKAKNTVLAVNGFRLRPYSLYSSVVQYYVCTDQT